jgi:hypothetical protein
LNPQSQRRHVYSVLASPMATLTHARGLAISLDIMRSIQFSRSVEQKRAWLIEPCPLVLSFVAQERRESNSVDAGFGDLPATSASLLWIFETCRVAAGLYGLYQRVAWQPVPGF